MNFPDKKYQIILADPSWDYNILRYQKSSSSQYKKLKFGLGKKNYERMTLEDICNLPVQQIADKNSCLFLWATSPNLKEAFQVMKSWGFTYKVVAFVWSKTNSRLVLGHYTRTNHEFVLLGTKGSLPRSHKVKQWIKAPATKHSKKPNEVRKRIIQLYGDLSRIELFARQKIPNWDCWGNDPNLESQPLEIFSHQLINKELLLD